MWDDAQPAEAAQPNIGGALCESSVIPFPVARRKVWLTPLLECRAVTLPIQENAGLGRKVNFARGKILSGARAILGLGRRPTRSHIIFNIYKLATFCMHKETQKSGLTS